MPDPAQDMGPHEALVTAVVLALTGETAAVAAPAGLGSAGASSAGDAVEAVVEALAAHGWQAPRLQELRRSRQQAEQPWPFTVPREVLATAGFARYGAVLREVRARLGLDGLVPTRHVGPKVLGPAEQRLLAEVPPHHGFVG